MSHLLVKIFALMVTALLLVTSPAWGLQKTPRPKDSKSADSTKQVAPAKPGTAAVKPLAPAPSKTTDSAKAKKPVPAKLNDFQDANKNGIDDRVEKKTAPKKPTPSTPTATKKDGTKKAEPAKDSKSTTITKTKKSK